MSNLLSNQSKIKTVVTLTILIAVALALRLWGNTYGVRWKWVPDESGKIEAAADYLEGDFFHTKKQPSMIFHMLFLSNAVADAALPLITSALPVLEPDPVFEQVQPHRIWMGRCFIALISSLTIIPIFLLGCALSGWTTGIIASTLFALNPISISLGSYIKEDTPLTLMVTLCLLMLAKHLQSGERRHLIWGALIAGMAFGAKYPGFVALVPVMMTIVLARPTEQRGVGFGKTFKALAPKLGKGFLLFLAGFFIVCPIYLIKPHYAFSGATSQVEYLGSGHWDHISIGPLEQFFTFYIRNALWHGMTPLVLVIAVIGAWWLAKQQRTIATLLISWAVLYLGLAEISQAKPYPFFSRYVLPIVPVLCVFAAHACTHLLRQPDRRMRGAVVTAVMLLWLAVVAGIHTAAMTRDTRLDMRDWVLANVPGDAIVLSSRYAIGPDDPGVPNLPLEIDTLASALASAEIEGVPVFVLFGSFDSDRYTLHPDKVPAMTALYESLMRDEVLVEEFSAPLGGFGFHNPTLWVGEFNSESTGSQD